MVASSRLMYAPTASLHAFMSSTGVWLEENMISLPVQAAGLAQHQMVREEQSTPQPLQDR